MLLESLNIPLRRKGILKESKIRTKYSHRLKKGPNIVVAYKYAQVCLPNLWTFWYSWPLSMKQTYFSVICWSDKIDPICHISTCYNNKSMPSMCSKFCMAFASYDIFVSGLHVSWDKNAWSHLLFFFGTFFRFLKSSSTNINPIQSMSALTLCTILETQTFLFLWRICLGIHTSPINAASHLQPTLHHVLKCLCALFLFPFTYWESWKTLCLIPEDVVLSCWPQHEKEITMFSMGMEYHSRYNLRAELGNLEILIR